MGTLQSENSLLSKAQAQLLTWEELLRTTGGAIDPLKSDWLFIRYKWTEGKWKYQTQAYPLQLVVMDKDKVLQPLRQLHITKARETLGVWIAGNGQCNTQCKQLRQKADTWTTTLREGRLDPTDTLIALQTTIYRSLTYCLPVTTLTQH